MTVTVNHWEPKSYVKAVQKLELSTSKLSMIGGAMIVALGATVAGGSNENTTAAAAAMVVSCGYIAYELFTYIANGGLTKVSKSTPILTLVTKAGEIIGTGGTPVSVEDMKVGGSGSCNIQDGITVGIETINAKYVINCAGSASDQIANMIGDTSFKIKPRLGDYLLLNRNQGYLAKHTLFPCPDPILGKGVLVQTTLWGNLILGPTARDMHKTDVATMSNASIQEYILSKCKALVPSFDPKETIHAFCGARAKSDRGDWIIEPSIQDGRMIHVAGIDSPGLAGSPAIAIEVVQLLQEAGCILNKDPTFNPRRAPIITPKVGMRGLKMGPVGKNDSDGTDIEKMKSNVICK